MITTEPVLDFYSFCDQYEEHIVKHYNDYAATYGLKKKVDLDKELFQNLIDLGSSNIFVIKEDEAFLGYISISITPSILFKGEIEVVVDHLYLTEEARGKGNFAKILDEVERTLLEQKVLEYKIGLPFTEAHAALADKHNFNKISCLYSKSLGE